MTQLVTEISVQRGTVSVLKFDLLWLAGLIGILTFLLIPASNEIFVQASSTHVYSMAFLKFAVLATMGELLAKRIMNRRWICPAGLLWRALIWGFLGTVIALVFYLYATGVSGALHKGLLPSPGAQGFALQFSFAIFTSTLMNLLFAPTFMAFHRVTDTYIDLGKGKLNKITRLTFSEVLDQIDWNSFIKVVVCKTIPLFWIPAHTITFMLPQEHRVLAAAFLSIALGAILAISKKQELVAGYS